MWAIRQKILPSKREQTTSVHGVFLTQTRGVSWILYSGSKIHKISDKRLSKYLCPLSLSRWFWRERSQGYNYFHISCQFGNASLWRVGTCRWRVDGDRRLSYWLNFVAAVRNIERRLDCVNVRPTFSQWERRWSPSSTWNYVSTRKQQNTLQLPTIKKIAVQGDIRCKVLAALFTVRYLLLSWAWIGLIEGCDWRKLVLIIYSLKWSTHWWNF